VLEESDFEHPEVTNRELVEARLMNFGNSSLDFELLFFSKNIFRIGKEESDIRRHLGMENKPSHLKEKD
jgi:small-conductance mechanosensitive channel